MNKIQKYILNLKYICITNAKKKPLSPSITLNVHTNNKKSNRKFNQYFLRKLCQKINPCSFHPTKFLKSKTIKLNNKKIKFAHKAKEYRK